MAFCAAAKDIPADSEIQCQRVSYVVVILKEGGVVRVGLRGENILRKVVRLISRCLAHAQQERREIAAVACERDRTSGGIIERVLAAGKGRLTYVHEFLLVFESGAEFMPSHDVSISRARIAVFAGEDEGVVVSCATDRGGEVAKRDHGDGVILDLLRERLRESQGGDVKAILARIAGLVFVMAGEGVAQLENRGRAQGVVIRQENVPAVGNVLIVERVIHVAAAVEVGIGKEEPLKGKPAEDALFVAEEVVSADVELLSFVGIETRSKIVVDVICALAWLVWLGEQRGEFEGDRVEVPIGNDIALEGLPCAVRVVRGQRVIDGETVRREIARTLSKGRYRKRPGLEALLLRCFIIRKEEELLMQDRPAN